MLGIVRERWLTQFISSISISFVTVSTDNFVTYVLQRIFRCLSAARYFDEDKNEESTLTDLYSYTLMSLVRRCVFPGSLAWIWSLTLDSRCHRSFQGLLVIFGIRHHCFDRAPVGFISQGIALLAVILWTVTLVLAIAHFCEHLYRKKDEHEDQEDDEFGVDDGKKWKTPFIKSGANVFGALCLCASSIASPEPTTFPGHRRELPPCPPLPDSVTLHPPPLPPHGQLDARHCNTKLLCCRWVWRRGRLPVSELRRLRANLCASAPRWGRVQLRHPGGWGRGCERSGGRSSGRGRGRSSSSWSADWHCRLRVGCFPEKWRSAKHRRKAMSPIWLCNCCTLAIKFFHVLKWRISAVFENASIAKMREVIIYFWNTCFPGENNLVCFSEL